MGKIRVTILAFLGLSTLVSCATIPSGVSAVKGFQQERYLGTWYEIGRFDFRFEKGLDNTSANYTLNDDGSIAVRNRGYDYAKGKWKEARGRARFVADPRVAMLEVSFFGPFYAGYNVIALDGDYQYALVSGASRKYLWILSRDRVLPEAIKNEYVKIAKDLGYETDKLLWVVQDRTSP